MMLHKEVKTFGMPREGPHGDVQAIKVDDTVLIPSTISATYEITRTWKSKCDRVIPMPEGFG